MDRMDWNWNGKQDLSEEKTTYTVDEILAEFWSEYSEPDEQETVSAYEDADETYFDWEAGETELFPASETEEVFAETELSQDLTAAEEIIGEEPALYMEEEVRLPLDGENAAEGPSPELPATGQEKPAVQPGAKNRKGVWEQFPDSPPKETEETFVDTFDYSSLFKMFADPAGKADAEARPEEAVPKGSSAAEEEQWDWIPETGEPGMPKSYDDASEPEEEPATGEKTAGEEKEDGPRPLLAEDSLDFRDILREFMLGDQHPIYADIPGIGSRSEKTESVIPTPDIAGDVEERTEKADGDPAETPAVPKRRRYEVQEDFPLDLDRFGEARVDHREEPEETTVSEEPVPEPDPGRKKSRKNKGEPDSGTGGEVPENALLRMFRGFGSGVGSKKKALNSPSAFAKYEDYLPGEGTEEKEDSPEPETDHDTEGAHAAPDSDSSAAAPLVPSEEEDDELLYSGDFPPFGQWILNEMMNLWIRINGIGDRASTSTMEDEREDLGTEVNVANASRYYGSQITMLRMRFQIGLALLAVLAYLTMGFPVSGMLKTPKVCGAMCLGLQLTIMLLCLDVVTNAAVNLTRGKFGADTLAVLCCVFSSLDALIVAVGSPGTPHIPLCMFSSLALMGILFSSLLSARALRKSIRVPAIGRRAYCVTAEEGVRANRDITLLKSMRPTVGFVRRSEEAPPDEILFTKIAVFELLAAVVLSLFIGLVKHSVKDMLFILSAVLSCSVPLTALLAFALPFFIGSQRIFSSGAAVAGWSGIHDIGSSRNLIVTDRDLFPEDTVSIDTVRIFADESAERIIAYAGTMIAASGSGISPCFAELMEKNHARMRQVEDFQWLSGGGLQGRIEGHRVLCGSSDLMQLMDVKIPYRLVDRTTVLLAIDGVLYGIFKINYIGLPEVRTALQDLIASNRHPIFAILDFNITPEMLREVFDVATDGYDFPPYGDRFRISEAKPSETSKIAAVVCREGLGPLTHLADTGRSMYIAVRMNMIVTVLAAVLGMLLVFVKLVGTGMVSPWLPFVLMLLDIVIVTLISLFMRF